MFDPNLEPCYNALRLGVPRDSLAVVVASMNRASLWRTKEISHSVTLGSSTSKEFYLACRFDGHRSLVRDIAWAPGNIRGYDIVATACKDGFVRVFKVETPGKAGEEPRSKDYAKLPEKVVVPQSSSAENGGRNTPSGIGAGLANARPGPSGSRAPENQGKEGEVLHVATEVSKMAANRVPWTVGFDHDGQVWAQLVMMESSFCGDENPVGMEQVVGVGNGNVCCVLTMERTLTFEVSFRPIFPRRFRVLLTAWKWRS